MGENSSKMENITAKSLIGNVTVDIHPILPEIPLMQQPDNFYDIFGIMCFSVIGLFAVIPLLVGICQLLKWFFCHKIPNKLWEKKKFNIWDCTCESDCKSQKKKNSNHINCTGEMEIVHTLV